MEAAYLLNCGSIFINGFPIERGVQTRKHSGNYNISGFRVRLEILIIINLILSIKFIVFQFYNRVHVKNNYTSCYK